MGKVGSRALAESLVSPYHDAAVFPDGDGMPKTSRNGTCVIGKWQLDSTTAALGFDESVVHKGGGHHGISAHQGPKLYPALR
jgi:hypothetical protein